MDVWLSSHDHKTMPLRKGGIHVHLADEVSTVSDHTNLSHHIQWYGPDERGVVKESWTIMFPPVRCPLSPFPCPPFPSLFPPFSWLELLSKQVDGSCQGSVGTGKAERHTGPRPAVRPAVAGALSSEARSGARVSHWRSAARPPVFGGLRELFARCDSCCGDDSSCRGAWGPC